MSFDTEVIGAIALLLLGFRSFADPGRLKPYYPARPTLNLLQSYPFQFRRRSTRKKEVARNVPRASYRQGFLVLDLRSDSNYEKRLGTLKMAIRLAPRFIVFNNVPVKSRFRPFVGISFHDPVRVICLPRFTLFANSTSLPYSSVIHPQFDQLQVLL
jgi:hypothetical protein